TLEQYHTFCTAAETAGAVVEPYVGPGEQHRGFAVVAHNDDFDLLAVAHGVGIHEPHESQVKQPRLKKTKRAGDTVANTVRVVPAESKALGSLAESCNDD